MVKRASGEQLLTFSMYVFELAEFYADSILRQQITNCHNAFSHKKKRAGTSHSPHPKATCPHPRDHFVTGR